jgi:hypothetical protein
MIRAERARGFVVRVALPADLEYAVGGEQPKHAVQGIGISPDGLRKLGSGARAIVEVIRDAQLRHYVEAARRPECRRKLEHAVAALLRGSAGGSFVARHVP